MLKTVPGAQKFVPADARTLSELREAAAGCRGCELYRNASQVVFGYGERTAKVVMVGEQPGDAEDRQGLPFVGPAGKLLGRAMVDAGLDPDEVYLTNAVKHFKFQVSERGKRRIHQKPDRDEIFACRPWLVEEMHRLHPELLVVLGATAAQSLLGPTFRVTKSRGLVMPWPAAAYHPEDFPPDEAHAVATVHPSSVLRSDDRQTAYANLVADLRAGAETLDV